MIKKTCGFEKNKMMAKENIVLTIKGLDDKMKQLCEHLRKNTLYKIETFKKQWQKKKLDQNYKY